MKTAGKLFLPFAAAAAVLLSGCLSQERCPECRRPAMADCARNIFLPEKIYAVPGIECNIYFKNVFLAVNHANFIFDVECNAGFQETYRWSFTPAAADAGKSIPLKLQVLDQYGELAAEANTTVCVADPDAGKNREISILLIGDSLTNATEYVRQLKRLSADSPQLKMLGTNGGGGKAPVNGVVHEGYPGWTYQSFLSRYKDESKIIPRYRYGAKSKFLFEKNGKREFDFGRYLQKYHGGKVPDVVTIQLGVNDIFWTTTSDVDECISRILKNADTLIGYIRRDAPNAVIGVGYVTGGAGQDAFGVNYKSGKTSWNYYHNHFRLNQAMAEHFRKSQDKNLVMIPVNVNLDTRNNFPSKSVKAAERSSVKVIRQRNGVHPDYYGYRQMGDSYYAWLKNIISTHLKR